jgi:2-oxo-4-hydroxy-4-carboxy-5-ureidoimidazoline decarboxylase
MSPHTLSEINALPLDQFVQFIGPVFEHSPWIAEATWSKRPFADLESLHRSLCQTVAGSAESKRLALIRAHPDLVGRAAREGTLTPSSQAEQAGAGLDRLAPEEIALFQKLNAAYHERFEFPFVICARLNKKKAILNGFRTRLENSREREMETALAEISKIAYFRLKDIVKA